MSDTPRRVPLALPSTGEEEWQALREPVMSGWLTQGPQVEAFEQAFANRHGVPHAIATTSGTTALHLILAALEVGPGDEVIVPSFTWIATANAVRYCGATPVLADVERHTFNLDPRDVAARITPHTRAIVAVHLFGLCADMPALAEVAGEIPLVEDAACAAGGQLGGRPAGSMGIAGAFSFHPRKTLTTGEGGMVTTARADLSDRMRALRNHGGQAPRPAPQPAKPHDMPAFDVLGFNYRMSDLQAAIGRPQLKKLDDFIAQRRMLAQRYFHELADLPWLSLPDCPGHEAHTFQSFVCRVDEERAGKTRNQIMEDLAERGVATRPGTHAVHMLGLYQRSLGLQPDDLPASRDCDRLSMAIPLHNRLVEADIEHVIECLHRIAG